MLFSAPSDAIKKVGLFLGIEFIYQQNIQISTFVYFLKYFVYFSHFEVGTVFKSLLCLGVLKSLLSLGIKVIYTRYSY